jgi:hypothetical protein
VSFLRRRRRRLTHSISARLRSMRRWRGCEPSIYRARVKTEESKTTARARVAVSGFGLVARARGVGRLKLAVAVVERGRRADWQTFRAPLDTCDVRAPRSS